jgi:hypothetical protein
MTYIFLVALEALYIYIYIIFNDVKIREIVFKKQEDVDGQYFK